MSEFQSSSGSSSTTCYSSPIFNTVGYLSRNSGSPNLPFLSLSSLTEGIVQLAGKSGWPGLPRTFLDLPGSEVIPSTSGSRISFLLVVYVLRHL